MSQHLPDCHRRIRDVHGETGEAWLRRLPALPEEAAARRSLRLLRNPFPEILAAPGARSLLARRADQLAELLGFDRRRVKGWAFAQAVLSGWWELEDGGADIAAWIAVAELLG
jgi:streptomycin 6-kinase